MTDDATDSVEPAVGSDGPDPAEDGASRAPAPDPDDAYSGLLGAFPYALKASESWLFKSYALAGGSLALCVALLFALSVVVLLGQTAAAAGGSFTFSRAFFIFVGFLVVAPLVAPVLFVARRHRRGTADRRHDATLAGLGYLFVGSLFVALVISVPPELQEPVAGSLAPLVELLYALPQIAGLVPPFTVAVLVWLVGRRTE